ncbi:MAG: hypothetical protein IT563_01380 [Alphaproteobacteria bacterium]|nr:hypothetical protein [Alphaproteobacteria bacterium]
MPTRMKPVPDRAEVAIEFPDKAYMGTFSRSARYEVKADPAGVTLKLERHDDAKRLVELHLHYDLFAAVLDDLAALLRAQQPDPFHRELVKAAADRLADATAAP